MNTDDEIRDKAISYIEGLYPPDAAGYPKAGETGQALLGQIVWPDWRELPTEILAKFRYACEVQDRIELNRTLNRSH